MTNPDDKKIALEKGEKRLRRWILFLHLLSVTVVGLAFFPMVYSLWWVWQAMSSQPVALKILVFSFSIGFSYFLFGVTLISLCAFTKNIFGFKVTPGLFSIHSDECLSWMGYNSMILIANSAFLDVLRLSPFQTLFYRWMGAKIGNGVNVNTGGLADLSMLDIGDHVIIGGGVALICHASERGLIRLAPTKIGSRVSIGIASVILPDVEIGDGATIAPCSLVPKGTRIPPGSHWGGNPLRDLRAERRAAREEIHGIIKDGV